MSSATIHKMYGTKLLTPESFLKEKDKQQPRMFPSYRLAISMLSFSALFLAAQSQSSMGAAIVYMVNNGSHDTFETFDWDKQTQGWILSSRFLAFYLAQLPSGHLTSYISDKKMATIGFVAMGTSDVMTVPCAKHSVALLLIARVVQGFGNALLTTGSYGILGKWVPSHESSSLVGFAGTGFFAGSFPMFLFSFIVGGNPSLGWPDVFYLSGGLALLFSVFWYAFADNEPADSRWVGEKEKKYVMDCKQDEVFCRKIPWRTMVASGPMYAVALGQIACDWLYYFAVTVAPAYFTEVLHLSEGKAVLVCGVPFLLVIPVCTLFGRFLDVLTQRGFLTVVKVRRLAQAVGNLVPAACCLALALLPTSDTTAAVMVFLVCVVTLICTTSGWVANVSDLAPHRAGAAMSLCQTMALWPSFFVPLLVNYLTTDKTKAQWNTVFYISIGLQLGCFVGFCMLSSGEVQPWAKTEERIPLTSHEARRPFAPN